MWKKLLKELNLSDSYISMGLGLLVVIVVGLLVLNSIQNKGTGQTESGEQTSTAEESLEKGESGKHKVAEGETLWSISEKYYKTGYNWVDIAKANNLTDPGLIEVDQELTVPVVTPILAEEMSPSPTETPVANIPENYTVKTGDSLWSIAVAIYNNGYRWSDIAKANNLTNPDLIFSGNVLTLPK